MQELNMCEESQNEVIETVEVQDAAFKKITRRAQQGMTLIEIMVVIAIIGLIAGVVGVQVYWIAILFLLCVQDLEQFFLQDVWAQQILVDMVGMQYQKSQCLASPVPAIQPDH